MNNTQSDISPPSLKGSIGVLNQLGIVIGIFVAQLAGTFLTRTAELPAPQATEPLAADASTRASWRWVPAISALVSVAQLVSGGLLALESPRWEEESNAHNGGKKRAALIRSKLWSTSAAASSAAPPQAGRRAAQHRSAPSTDGDADPELAEETEALLGELAQSRHASEGTAASQVRFVDLVKDATIRPGMIVIILTQIGQQLSGVNAVLYYSTGILSGVLKGRAAAAGTGGDGGASNAAWISVGITVVNAIMTFPPIFLIPEHRFGRKRLLLLSTATMALSSLLLGISLQLELSDVLSAACILLFVMGFSVGLGPVPFLILPELVPSRAVSHASSVGLGFNWVSNIVLASSFLPLRNALTKLDGGHGGSIFWVFTAVNVITFLHVARLYRYQGEETQEAGDARRRA